MLSTSAIYAVLPASDLERAKRFYKEKLGLEPVKESPEVLAYQGADDTSFIIYQTDNAGSATNTAMGWNTADLETEMVALRAKGVVFEEYDLPGLKTVNGIAEGGGERAAWFRDSEGNILCLSQDID